MLELWEASPVNTSKMMTDRARSSLISAFRRHFLADGSVFQGQWDSAF
jgi:hypothetical protein